MKHIQLTFNITEELGLRSIIYDYNDTGLPSNSETLKKIAATVLRAIDSEGDSVFVQDLLNSVNMSVQPLTTPQGEKG